MGKKGKRSAKTGDGKPKQGPGKARRERAAAMKEINAGVTALVERLESKTQDVELFGPLPEQEECPICFVPLPRSDAESFYMFCCGKTICGGCGHASVLIAGKAKKKSLLCAFCRSEQWPFPLLFSSRRHDGQTKKYGEKSEATEEETLPFFLHRTSTIYLIYRHRSKHMIK